MPKETKRVRFDLVNNDLKPRFVDGQELPNWRSGPEMVDYLKQLEAEGWHLAGGSSGLEMVFERDAP